MRKLLTIALVSLAALAPVTAQEPASILFCDRAYSYGTGNDSIHVYFNLVDAQGKRVQGIPSQRFADMFYFYEDGTEIPNRQIRNLNSGVRIPADYTFSILLDLGLPPQGKEQVLDAIRKFVDVAPDSSVYISSYGDVVSPSVMLSRDNWDAVKAQLMQSAQGKVFYSGAYAKLAEFSPDEAPLLSQVKAIDYEQNPLISQRAAAHPGKNILMIFADGTQRPDVEDLDYIKVTDYQTDHSQSLPKVNAFYFKGEQQVESEDAYDGIELLLQGLTEPKDANRQVIRELFGMYAPATQMSDVLKSFATVVQDATYDYEILYTATDGKIYAGNVDYSARWGRNQDLGAATFTIGSAEHPWPDRELGASSIVIEILVALLVTVLTFAFFYLIMKVLVPYIAGISFRSKYYKKYQPRENVQRRICHYCKQDLRPGQVIVTKCSHWMHKHCWEENGYKCAEYGQNCKTGIQEHVDWKGLFRWSAIKECSQTIAGVLAGLLSWIIYELCGRGGLEGLARWIVMLVFGGNEEQASIVNDCVTRASSFLMIGMLLGFFIPIIFRYKDDVRNKDWRVWAKIFLLSVLTAIIGMLAFAIGADIMCLLLMWTGKTYIPWYCSLPAYVLFSLSVSLALTIKSTIPVKSALWGGLCSAVIGFLVLYFSHFASARYDWLNMLLAFIIYGGGLGASLITVRMLAEKYFLVIQNGIKAGQRIPIHKWMNATGGGNKVSIGMTGECEIQMNWEKSNKVAKEHAKLFIDNEKNLPVIKPLATGVIYNARAELPVNRQAVLSNGDTFKIGDTIFKYEEA
ncbi:MAG: hypothetical protein LIO91_00830 [Bacteroidales bacterium]|nr:hypothetical protein [Bacteroidales bacterium]